MLGEDQGWCMIDMHTCIRTHIHDGGGPVMLKAGNHRDQGCSKLAKGASTGVFMYTWAALLTFLAAGSESYMYTWLGYLLSSPCVGGRSRSATGQRRNAAVYICQHPTRMCDRTTIPRRRCATDGRSVHRRYGEWTYSWTEHGTDHRRIDG